MSNPDDLPSTDAQIEARRSESERIATAAVVGVAKHQDAPAREIPTREDILAALRNPAVMRYRSRFERIDYSDDEDPITFSAMDEESMLGLWQTSINFAAELPVQKVTVEYLKSSQKLVIPYALGMHWTIEGAGLVRVEPILLARYAKASRMSYLEIVALIDGANSLAEITTTVDAREAAVLTERFSAWNEMKWAMVGLDQYAEHDIVNRKMATLSRALGFNCDIRDFGILLLPGMTVSDSEWSKKGAIAPERLMNKLKPETLLNIAALNYDAVENQTLAAWTRAVGVGIGLLPDKQSKYVTENVFKKVMPSRGNLEEVIKFQADIERTITPIALNLLAMYGIFHLNKDHTFRAGDPNMHRIGRSYLDSLRTGTNDGMIEVMKAHQEVYVRTCQQPFGLAQTYWLARVMTSQGYTMLPLATKMGAAPPEVQRVMIVEATTNEWGGVPAGRELNVKYRDEIERVRRGAEAIRGSPPKYSRFHSLYGVEEQAKVSRDVESAVTALMPIVYGYVEATHVDERGGRDGLGYAQSLKNVERDMKGAAMMWKSLWKKYMCDVGKNGLLK